MKNSDCSNPSQQDMERILRKLCDLKDSHQKMFVAGFMLGLEVSDSNFSEDILAELLNETSQL